MHFLGFTPLMRRTCSRTSSFLFCIFILLYAERLCQKLGKVYNGNFASALYKIVFAERARGDDHLCAVILCAFAYGKTLLLCKLCVVKNDVTSATFVSLRIDDGLRAESSYEVFHKRRIFGVVKTHYLVRTEKHTAVICRDFLSGERISDSFFYF